MTGIEFGEPPAVAGKGQPGGQWVPIFEALRARPGEWAKVRTCPTRVTARSTVQYIRTGYYKGGAPGEFEAVTRERDVWARYVGGAS